MVGDERVSQLLAPDAQAAVVQIPTTAGDAGAQRIRHEIAAAFAPVDPGAHLRRRCAPRSRPWDAPLPYASN